MAAASTKWGKGPFSSAAFALLLQQHYAVEGSVEVIGGCVTPSSHTHTHTHDCVAGSNVEQRAKEEEEVVVVVERHTERTTKKRTQIRGYSNSNSSIERRLLPLLAPS